ncbi:MAG: ATP-binding protein [Acidobacteriota bacterium]|jgi:signal transduction histidine kinase
MRKITYFLKRHNLWMGFLAVLVPLGLLLSMQYDALAKLERYSAMAHKTAMENFLEAVGSNVRYFYTSLAERTLNLPASVFTEEGMERAALHWRKVPAQGASRLFLVSYTDDLFGRFRFFDPERGLLEVPPASDEAMAIISAATPWQVLSLSGGFVESTELRVDERDPERRIILKPITNDQARIVGLAGMVLDEEFFREDLLPGILEEALPHFFPDASGDALLLTVTDDRGAVAFGADEHEGEGETASRPLQFAFTDWTVSLHRHGVTPEQWARQSFLYNISLSALVAFGLLGGVVLALRAANKAMRLSEMKSDFVSNVSHELRTPLASIRVFGELLRTGRARSVEKAQEYGEYIEAESRRLSRLIDNILDFSRIESGLKTYQFVPSDVGELLDSLMHRFEVRMRNSGFEADYDRPADSLPPVEFDPDAISQAVNNLLDNAVKYSGDSRRLRVSLARERDMVVISVQDHGIGIARDEQKKIFERFHRVGTGLVHDVKGSGLGLSIVHHVVAAHRGKVTVDSEPGRGTTISIHLPVAAEPAAGIEFEENRTAAS